MSPHSEAFNACSAEIKNWLIRQPDVDAGTLTNWLLENLAANSNTIRYKQLSDKSTDISHSADWEWWFVLSDQSSFAARVLAKKLDSSVDNYPEIAGTHNGNLRINQFLDESAKDGYAAFYVFYSTNDRNSSICKNGKSPDGIFHSEANKVRQELMIKEGSPLHLSDILAISNPVSCAFGCPGIYGEGMEREAGFRQHIGHYFPMRSDHLTDQSQFRELGFRNTPAHIIELLSNGTDLNHWEKHHQQNLKGSKAIVAIDLRN
jgi:hypothetical protein